jgi:hypothetical protein
MARKFILENLMKLAQGIGANPSKFMGTKTNISFLGSGPTKNPLFQRPLAGIDNASMKQLGPGMIPAVEDAMGFATAGKLNDIQLKILTENLSGINKILNPPPLPMASVTPIRSGIAGLKDTMPFGRTAPLTAEELAKLRAVKPLREPKNLPPRSEMETPLRSQLPEPGPGDVAAFQKALDMQTGMSRAIARNLLLKDTRLKLKPEELFMLKEGKGEPLDLMRKYYGESMHQYDDFLNSVNLEAARPDEFAEIILKNVELIPVFAHGGLARILEL